MVKKLYFRFGAMNSGKSTALLQVAFNYHERGMRAVIAKPAVDTKSSQVSSRLGIEYNVDWRIAEDTSFLRLLKFDREANRLRLKCIIVDEAQFLSPKQVDELFEIAVVHNIPVIAYGLKTDFKTHSFPGSLRLLELAHSLEELKTICRCGSKAMFNGRKIDGEFVNEGAVVAIDGVGTEYESLCSACRCQKIGLPKAAPVK